MLMLRVCTNSTTHALRCVYMHVPLSSCRPDSVVWLWTEMTAGMCVMCSQVWLQTPGPSVEGTGASAAPEDWKTNKNSFNAFRHGGKSV